jgi:type 1 glutamine amidotransferase
VRRRSESGEPVFERASRHGNRPWGSIEVIKMKTVLLILAGATMALAQNTPPAQGQGRGRGGPQAPPVASLSQRPLGGLSSIRLGGSGDMWFNWSVGVPAQAFRQMTWSESLVKIDLLSVDSHEVSSGQKAALEVPKPMDHRLQRGERNAVLHRLREMNQRIGAYRVDDFPADAAARRSVLQFAKDVNAGMVIIPEQTVGADLEKLAEEIGINIAVESKKDPKSVMAAVEGRGRRIGVAADLGGWMQAGIKPVDGLPVVKDRLMFLSVTDRSALGPRGKDVTLGSGAGALSDFFLAAFRAGVKPLYISVQDTGAVDTFSDLLKSLNGYEAAMWPAMAARVRQMLDTPAGKIRGPERLSPDVRARIEAAAPREAIVKPKKPRKLLVTDIQMYSGHGTIPHGNYMLELMAKNTGAFEPTFSNDLELLKWPRIREWDAIFLNNVCGMVYNDPEVREGILRYVREGGGIGGNHAVTYASNNWPEWAELMGGWAGAHRTEKQVLKIDDPSSPLMKMFGSEPFEHTDEFYQFPPWSPYTREKQHVLMSIDVERSDRANGDRFCAQCTRPDQDYGVAWIKQWGKGRTYFTPLGHTDIMYTDKRWTQHMLAAVQYILGDLEADATPSARLKKK